MLARNQILVGVVGLEFWNSGILLISIIVIEGGRADNAGGSRCRPRGWSWADIKGGLRLRENGIFKRKSKIASIV